MSYHGPKPFGRRRTDQSVSDPERRQLQMIRRDVDEDDTGTIRRYLRLASRILGKEEILDAPRVRERRLDHESEQAA